MDFDNPSWYVPAILVVAFSLYFFAFPLLITVPLFFGAWLIWKAFESFTEWLYVRKHTESQQQRYERWYGEHASEELFNDTFAGAK